MPESAATFSWMTWHWHPEVIIGLLLLEYVYLLGVGPLRRRYGWAGRVERRQVVTFSLGVVVLFVALLSPVAELAEGYWFSAHMVQHVLLIMAAVPLLLLGTPGWLLRPVPVARVARLVTQPLIAFGLFNANLLLWHVPLAYDLTLTHNAAHAVQHVLFIVTAVLAWWPILSPLPELPRLPYPGQMLYLFAQSVPMGFLGAALTFASDAFYAPYAAAPRLWGLSALVDQQIGGLVMKTVGGLVFLAVLAAVFFRWAGREESDWARPGPS